MGKTNGAKPMPKVDDANQPTVYKAPPRRLRMARPETPPPAPIRPPRPQKKPKS